MPALNLLFFLAIAAYFVLMVFLGASEAIKEFTAPDRGAELPPPDPLAKPSPTMSDGSATPEGGD